MCKTIIFISLLSFSVSAKDISKNDTAISADYCFKSKFTTKLILQKVYKPLPSISVSDKDSIECNDWNFFDFVDNTFHIQGITDSLAGVRGGVAFSIKCKTTTSFDAEINKIVKEKTECVTEAHKKKYSSVVKFDFPKEKSLAMLNGDTLPLGYIQKLLGKPILATWKSSSNCSSIPNTTLSGTYFIRIVGECPKE